MPDEPRRFPPPWSAEEADPELDRRCFVVRDANGQALAYVYFEEEPGRVRLSPPTSQSCQTSWRFEFPPRHVASPR
jgi:hypothetical protein